MKIYQYENISVAIGDEQVQSLVQSVQRMLNSD